MKKFFTANRLSMSPKALLTAVAILSLAGYLIFSGVGLLEAAGSETAQLKGSAPSNLNQSTPTALQWNDSQELRGDAFSFSSGNNTRLTVEEAGDYLVTVNIPQNSNVARSNITASVYVNGAKQDVGIGASGYIRNTNDHTESSVHITAFLSDLSASDYIEIFVEQEGDSGTVNAETHTLYAERLGDDKTVFAARGDETVAGTNLNQTSKFVWATEDRKDAGYTHAAGSETITLDDAGDYLVLLNIPERSPSTERTNAIADILLDGVSQGQAKQGYIRKAFHDESSVHFAGVVQASASGQDLEIEMSQEAAPGTVTTDGENANIIVIKLPSSGVYYGEATQADGNNDWNPNSGTYNVDWATDQIIDTGVYSHSTTNNNHQITVDADGDYFFTFTVPFGNNGTRQNAKQKVLVNGVAQAGFQGKSDYVRNNDNHTESSNIISGMLTNLSAGDTISMTTEAEAALAGVDVTDHAHFMLWKKEVPVQVAAPTVATDPASNIATSSATGNGEITDTGGEDADERGFVFGTASQADPGNTAPGSTAYDDSTTETGTFPAGSFSDSLTNLSPDTTYYVRAFGHNSAGYSYGGEVSFTTDQLPAGTPFGGNPSGTYGDTDWQYRQKITIQSSEVDSNLTDFPVYVDLSDFGSSFFSNVNSDGSDIRITAGDGTTELAREVVSVDTGAETGEVHFKADSLSATEDTSFYMYYGNPSAVDYADPQTYGTENVWTNGFAGVWHFEETPDQDGSTTEIKDSTGNQNDGDTEGAMTAGDSQAGKLSGSSLNFDEVDDAVVIPGDDSLNRPDTDWEIRGWANTPDNTGNDFQYYFSWGGFLADPSYNFYSFEEGSSDPGQFNFRPSDNAGTQGFVKGGQISTSSWQHISLRSNDSSGNIRMFIDDSLAVTSGDNLGSMTDNTLSLFFGGRSDRNADRYFGGRLDEWRLTQSHSPDWLSAEYTNQDTPSTFYTVGAQQTEEDAPGAGGGPATTSTRIRGGSDIRGGTDIR